MVPAAMEPSPELALEQAVFSAMGTTWAVYCSAPGLLRGAEAVARDAERRLSRFSPDSALSRLNAERHVRDGLLASVVRAALRLSQGTGGAFDPTVGAAVRGWGYRCSFERMGGDALVCLDGDRPSVSVDGDRVCLQGGGSLDLGGIAKGYTVDRVHAWLRRRGAVDVLIDGGGDIRGSGRAWRIGVGPRAAVYLRGDAVATSSTRRRRWRLAGGGVAHHVISPRTGRPALTWVDTVTVRAANAVSADALATAVLADPERTLPLLAGLGASALVRGGEGDWWATPQWEAAR